MQKMIDGVRGLCLVNVDSFSMSTTYCDKEFVARLGVLLEQNKEEALAIQQRNRQNEIRRYALESIHPRYVTGMRVLRRSPKGHAIRCRTIGGCCCTRVVIVEGSAGVDVRPWCLVDRCCPQVADEE